MWQRPLLLATLGAIAISGAGCTDRQAAPAATPEAVAAKREATDRIYGYNSSRAMNLSGQHVPTQVMGYYFIEILEDDSDAAYIAELSQLMNKAHVDKDYLGIIGEDAARMRQLILDSLDGMPDGSLSNATIIVIGRAQDESVLRPAVEASGAEFRFGVYVAADTPTL